MIKNLLKLGFYCLLVTLCSCSLLGGKQWSAYSVIIEVQNDASEGVANAVLEANDMKTKITGEEGRAKLKFRTAGIHVVTISADHKATKQVKIQLPQDDNKIINIVLNTKP